MSNVLSLFYSAMKANNYLMGNNISEIEMNANILRKELERWVNRLALQNIVFKEKTYPGTSQLAFDYLSHYHLVDRCRGNIQEGFGISDIH